MRVTVFDYGAGNLHSLGKALAVPPNAAARAEVVSVRVETDPARAVDTDLLVLPGVGAFGAAAERLAPGRSAMRAAIASGLPVIGICLGMQLLLDGSDEGPGAGLGVIPGRVTKLCGRRVPQIGWNTLDGCDDPLFDAAPLAVAYYANGYVCRPDREGSVRAWSEHEGERYPAMLRAGHVVGVQFHPEKSSAAGAAWLRAAIQEAAR